MAFDAQGNYVLDDNDAQAPGLNQATFKKNKFQSFLGGLQGQNGHPGGILGGLSAMSPQIGGAIGGLAKFFI